MVRGEEIGCEEVGVGGGRSWSGVENGGNRRLLI